MRSRSILLRDDYLWWNISCNSDYKDQLIPNYLYSIFINVDLVAEKVYALLTLIREESYPNKNPLNVNVQSIK